MPECKYCGETISTWYLFGVKFISGSYPTCPNCGADDDTLEIAVDQNS